MLKTTAVAAARLGIALYIYEDKWYMANFGVDAEGNLSQPYYWHLEDPEWTCSPDDQTVLDNLQLWEDDGTDVLLPNATQPIYLALEDITQPFQD